MGGPDLLKNLAEPARSALRDALAPTALPPAAATALLELLDVGAVALLAAALAAGASALLARVDRRPWPAWSGGSAFDARFVLCAAASCPLLWWLLGHPSPFVFETFTRGDPRLFATLAGCASCRLPVAGRRWLFVILSLAFLFPYYGALALAVVLGANAGVFLALRNPMFRRTGAVVLLHVALFATLYALSLWLRPRNLLQAMQMYGLFSFVILRQISAAVAMRAGDRPPLGSYLCYLTFYPSNAGLLGGPEVYPDFARRNLQAPPRMNHRAVASRVARGALQLWIANRIPVSFADVLAATTTAEVWADTLLLFFAGALKAMGLWAMIEASALLLGFLLQPNFSGLLTRTNPSELWWAWRGTFTNWLVRYVYGPLGASRRHQALNVAAAFGVSWLWHVIGTPFLGLHASVAQVAPMTLWAALNIAAVVGHLEWQRRRWTVLPPATPERVRRVPKIALVWMLASFNVTPLNFQGDQIGRFWDYLRLLVGR